MSHLFNVGDKVKRISHSAKGINVGDVVTVAKLDDNGYSIEVTGAGAVPGNYDGHCFQLVEAAPIPCEPPSPGCGHGPAGKTCFRCAIQPPPEQLAAAYEAMTGNVAPSSLQAENDRLREGLRLAREEFHALSTIHNVDLAEMQEERDFWRRECGRTPAGKRLVEARERTAGPKERG